jgi:hypothetical protein
MKQVLPLALLLIGVTSTTLNAQTDATKKGYQSATVVHVDQHMMPANPIGGVIDNGVPQPQEYSYDVSIRLGCEVYVGRYESPIHYLPPVFAPNHNVNVRLDGDFLNVSLPDAKRAMKLGIVSSEQASDPACAAND